MRLAAAAKEKLEPAFAPLGLSLQSLVIENISLPEEVEKAIDKRTTMGVLGDMGDYTRYQAAEAIRDFAQNEGGGMAGIGVGLGAGAQVGQVFASAMNANTAPASPVAPAGTTCALCGADVPAGAKFCPGMREESPSVRAGLSGLRRVRARRRQILSGMRKAAGLRQMRRTPGRRKILPLLRRSAGVTAAKRRSDRGEARDSSQSPIEGIGRRTNIWPKHRKTRDGSRRRAFPARVAAAR